METSIELENIRVEKGDTTLFHDMNVSFPKGITSVIMGPSGSGKSTMLKIAAGIDMPDSGTVFVYGKPLMKMSEKEMMAFRKENGFVFQDAALWSNKSVYQNLSLPMEFHFRHLDSVEIRRRINVVLKKIGFRDNPDLRPAQLSIGERKMASFARALVNDPKLIFMDSPLISIDSEIIDRIIGMILELKQAGKTIIISTHNPALVSRVADYLIVIKKGTILETGKFDTVVQSTNREVITILTDVLSKAATYDGDILSLLDGDDT